MIRPIKYWGMNRCMKEGKGHLTYRGDTNISLTKTGQKMYVVGSKSFRPDIQKPRLMKNAVRDIYSAIYGELMYQLKSVLK